MNDKLKINVSYSLYRNLLSDMSYFGFTKNDGQENRSQFINRVFSSYYKESLDHIKEISKFAIKRNPNYTKSQKQFVYRFALHSSIRQTDESNKDYSFQLFLSKYNEEGYESVKKFFGEQFSASEFFRFLLQDFVVKKAGAKENYLFAPEISTITEAIAYKSVLKIKTQKGNTYLFPKSISEGKHIRHLFLVGVEYSTRKIISIPLYTITKISESTKQFKEKPQEKDFSQMTIHFGAEYPINSYDTIEVELTEKGIALFNARPQLRPEVFNIADNHFYFHCSKQQALDYFLPFGSDAKFISPKSIVEDILNILKNTLENY